MANTIVFGRFYHGRQAESGSPQQGGVIYFLVKKLPYQRAVSENRAGVCSV